MSHTVAFFVRAGRRLARLAPEPLRSNLQADGVATLEEVCRGAEQQRGQLGLLLTGLTELASLALAAIRPRIHADAPLTSGLPPQGPFNRREVRLMPRLLNDFRLAVRSLLAARLPVTIAFLTLALGVGVTSAVFSVVDAVLIRPVPFAQGDRLAEIWNLEAKSQVMHPGFSRALLLDWRRQTDLFDRVEGFDNSSFIYASATGADMVNGSTVTSGLLPMLGVRPLEGRLLVAGDGRADGADVVLISERFWRQQLRSRPGIVGTFIDLNGRRHEVIGVMAAGFRFPNETTQFWVPYDLDAPPAHPTAPTQLAAFVRVRPGVDLTAATAAVKERGTAMSAAAGGSEGRQAVLQFAGRGADRRFRQSILVLAGAVGFLLLIVCANLANLSLSRTLARSRDFAVRTSLGASRIDLVRETLVEHLLIGVAGAIAGLGIAAALLQVAVTSLPSNMQLVGMNAVDLDGRAVLFTALVGITAAVLFGLPPAWLASRPNVMELLRRDSRASTGSVASKRLRGVLVIAEVTLAIVLLVGAALMLRSFLKLQSVDRGFDANGLVAMRLGLPTSGYQDPYARDAFTAALMDRARRAPGVVDVTAGDVPPNSSMISFGQLEVADRQGTLSEQLIVPVYQVWSNYFSTVGIPIRQGRAFTPDEPRESAIVSESFARRFWPNASAIGQRFRFEGGAFWRTVVGVAGEVRQLALDDAEGGLEMYYPMKRPAGLPVPSQPALSGAIAGYRTIVVRATDVDAVIEPMRVALRDVDARVVVWRQESVERLFADAIARPRILMFLMSVFAGLGLILAAAGLYGVLSYAVVQRRREIGIRLALGARPQGVARLIVRSGMILTAIGIVAGTVLALGLVGTMRALLYEVEPTDPLSLVGVAMLLIGVALVASWSPARRAMRIDPIALLRDE